MQITEVGLNSQERVIALLSIGFPQRSTSEWVRLFDRLRTTLAGKNQPDCAPGEGPRIGWLLGNVQAPDGVLLGFLNPMVGIADNKQLTQVNLSSWYVKEERRAQAIWMLRKCSNLPGHIFTDVTPSEAVARMLPSLGYSPISGGMLRMYTPQAVLTSRNHWRVISAEKVIGQQTDPSILQALKDHLALGCIVVGLVLNDYCIPFVLKKSIRRRVVQAAEVIYMPIQKNDLQQNAQYHPRLALPTLARWLAARGVMLLEIEKPVDDSPAIPLTQKLVNARPRFARGPYPVGAINHLYSELAYA